MCLEYTGGGGYISGGFLAIPSLPPVIVGLQRADRLLVQRTHTLGVRDNIRGHGGCHFYRRIPIGPEISHQLTFRLSKFVVVFWDVDFFTFPAMDTAERIRNASRKYTDEELTR